MKPLLMMVVTLAIAANAFAAEPQQPVADQVREYVARLADLQHGEARTQVVETIVALGDRAKPTLRDLARTTKDSCTVLHVAEVAVRLDMTDVAEIYIERLQATDPDPLPEYMGLAVVKILGEAKAYPRLADLALAQRGQVCKRILHAIGYSARSHNPLPTLDTLAARLDGDDRVLAYEEMLSALASSGAYILDPMQKEEPQILDSFRDRLLETADLEAIAKMQLEWIVRDQRFDGSKPGEAKGRCPYPADGRALAPPFGVTFREANGGCRCFILTDQGVAETEPKSLTTTPVQVNRMGEFASVSFMDVIGDEATGVIFLLRKGAAGWAYGGHMRTAVGHVGVP